MKTNTDKPMEWETKKNRFIRQSNLTMDQAIDLELLIKQAIQATREETVEEITKEAHKVVTVWDLKDFYKYLDSLTNKSE